MMRLRWQHVLAFLLTFSATTSDVFAFKVGGRGGGGGGRSGNNRNDGPGRSGGENQRGGPSMGQSPSFSQPHSNQGNRGGTENRSQPYSQAPMNNQVSGRAQPERANPADLNRNQPGASNAGAAATGATYANRNQPGVSNAGAAATGAAYANRNNESVYHDGVVNGYWNRNAATGWGTAAAYGAAGAAVGYAGGVGAWGTGSPVYGWGYSGYNNPYYGGMATGGATGVQQAQPAYNYSQPISTTAPPPEQATADSSTQLFDQARQAFLAGSYDQALDLDQKSLKLMPNDGTLHEFLALVLFAEGKYDQAASPLYAVLSVGPGWDWTTLIGMYQDVDTYTQQVRALEAFTKANPKSASGHFVLAYHYITQGHDKAAVDHLKTVVAIRPDDKLSAQLIKELQPPADPSNPPTAVVATNPPTDATRLQGSWTSKAAPDGSIILTLKDDGAFTWAMTSPGKPPLSITGQSTFNDNVLTLNSSDAQKGAIAGTVSLKDDSHFLFRAVGGPSDDPGLAFTR